MGKKSKEPGENKEEAAKSLFGTDNPFHRKRQPNAAGGSTQPMKKLRLGIDSSAAEKETITEAKVSDVEHSDARKRKRDREITAETPNPSSSNEESISRKLKKLVEETEVDGLFESDLPIGKKSKEPMENKEAAKAHFGADDPFRRKPQPDAAGGSTQPMKKLRLGIDSSATEKETITETKASDVEHSDARKRKRDREIPVEAPNPPSSHEEFIPRKRKKLVEEAEVDGLFDSDLQMRKKSKEPREDKEEAAKSHFVTDNPFRRKPQPEAADDSTQPTKKLRLGIDSSAAEKETEAKVSDVEHSDARNERRDGETTTEAPSPPSSDAESIPRKPKKLVEEAGVDGLKKNNKRKRDEMELKYEKMKFGSVGEDDPAATVLAVGEKRKVDAAAADMLDVKEFFDDESKLLRTVFVGNLPLKTKRKALNREFARFGEIESVRIRSVPIVDTKAPSKAAVIKGKKIEEVDSMNAYIVFKEEQSAHIALSYNMTQIVGNRIRVEMACQPYKKMKSNARL